MSTNRVDFSILALSARNGDLIARHTLIERFYPVATNYALTLFKSKLARRIPKNVCTEACKLLEALCSEVVVTGTSEYLSSDNDGNDYSRSMTYLIVRTTRKFISIVSRRWRSGSAAIDKCCYFSSAAYEHSLSVGELLGEILNTMQPDERAIIEYRFGLPGGNASHSMQETVEEFGLEPDSLEGQISYIARKFCQNGIAEDLAEYLSV